MNKLLKRGMFGFVCAMGLMAIDNASCADGKDVLPPLEDVLKSADEYRSDVALPPLDFSFLEKDEKFMQEQKAIKGKYIAKYIAKTQKRVDADQNKIQSILAEIDNLRSNGQKSYNAQRTFGIDDCFRRIRILEMLVSSSIESLQSYLVDNQDGMNEALGQMKNELGELRQKIIDSLKREIQLSWKAFDEVKTDNKLTHDQIEDVMDYLEDRVQGYRALLMHISEKMNK